MKEKIIKGTISMRKFFKKVMSKLVVVPFLVLSLATPTFAAENSSKIKSNKYPIVLVHGFMGDRKSVV